MEIRQLKYFIEIYRHGSFSKAADACYITAAGISLAITRLEDELGCKLFLRQQSGLSLTEQGKFLLPYAQNVVAQIEECKAHFETARKDSRHLSVAFALGTLEEFAGEPLSRFRRENPDVIVDVSEAQDTVCDAAVENGEVEFALTVGPMLGCKRLDATLLYSTRNALLVHEGHSLANRECVTVKELKDVSMVIQRETTRSSANFRACCKAAGFEPVISTYADDVLLPFYLASIGHAAGIASYTLAKRINRPHVCAIPFKEPEMAWNIYLIKSKTAYLSTSARKLENMLLKYSAELGKDSPQF